MEWETYFDSFIISPDERDAVCGYVNNQEYEEIKKKVQEERESSDRIDIDNIPIYYDYYSDYYLYYTMAAELEASRKGN